MSSDNYLRSEGCVGGGGFSCLKDRMLEKISTNQNRQAFLLAKCLSHKIEVNINRKCIKSVENNKKNYELRVRTQYDLNNYQN